MSSVQLVGIVGSLRMGSANGAAARAALDATGADVTLTLTLHDVSDVPLYNGDEEEAGPPATVVALHEAVRIADGIVLFSPEYNSSLPAVTKNVIDWLSRDPSAWDGTGITMVAMSPGVRAGLGAREHFEAIMPRQASRLFPTLGLGSYGDRLGDDGEVNDTATRDELAEFLGRFAEHCNTPE
jgi:chromate reductase